MIVEPEDLDRDIQLEEDWQLEMSFRCRDGKKCPDDPDFRFDLQFTHFYINTDNKLFKYNTLY